MLHGEGKLMPHDRILERARHQVRPLTRTLVRQPGDKGVQQPIIAAAVAITGQLDGYVGGRRG